MSLTYLCKVCGKVCRANDFEGIVKNKKLCDEHLDAEYMEQNGVIKQKGGGLRRENTRKNKNKKKSYWYCPSCDHYYDFNPVSCFRCKRKSCDPTAEFKLVLVRKYPYELDKGG